jgi:hypothetical protein
MKMRKGGYPVELNGGGDPEDPEELDGDGAKSQCSYIADPDDSPSPYKLMEDDEELTIQEFAPNNSVTVRLWPDSTQRTKYRIGMSVFYDSNGRYYEIGDFPTMGNPDKVFFFRALCVSDMVDHYLRNKKRYDSKNERNEFAKVKSLLTVGGVDEFSKFYISRPLLVKSLILLIGGGLLFVADNDIAKLLGVVLLGILLGIWATGIWQRSRCRPLDAKTYFDEYLKPASRLDAERKKPLTSDRKHIFLSSMFPIVGLISGGGVLLSEQNLFILNPETNAYVGLSSLGLGMLGFFMWICCACRQVRHNYETEVSGRPRRGDSRSSSQGSYYVGMEIVRSPSNRGVQMETMSPPPSTSPLELR